MEVLAELPHIPLKVPHSHPIPSPSGEEVGRWTKTLLDVLVEPPPHLSADGHKTLFAAFSLNSQHQIVKVYLLVGEVKEFTNPQSTFQQ